MLYINLKTFRILHVLVCLPSTLVVSQAYQQYAIEDDTLCSQTFKHKVILTTGKFSSLIVSLSNTTKLKQFTKLWKDGHFICEFQVKATNEDDGIFAVIQNITFRQDRYTTECLDYVQYKAVNSSFKSKSYCGQVEKDLKFSPALKPSSDSFVEANNALDVYVNISPEPLKPYRKLELEIVFTSFRYCFKKLANDVQCGPEHTAHCIDKTLINDGYINCPYPRCVDETRCEKTSQTKPKESDFSRTAITLISLMGSIFFVIGIWFGCKVRIHSNETFHVPSCNNRELADGGEIHQMTQVIDDVDPPSYESLFPTPNQTQSYCLLK